jgi:hypothetical protein
MNRFSSFSLLALGVILIICGISASDSIGSDFSRLFTGAPTDKTIWLLIGGVAATVVGVGGLLGGKKA